MVYENQTYGENKDQPIAGDDTYGCLFRHVSGVELTAADSASQCWSQITDSCEKEDNPQIYHHWLYVRVFLKTQNVSDRAPNGRHAVFICGGPPKKISEFYLNI